MKYNIGDLVCWNDPKLLDNNDYMIIVEQCPTICKANGGVYVIRDFRYFNKTDESRVNADWFDRNTIKATLGKDNGKSISL